MAKVKDVNDELKDLRVKLQDEKVLIGTERVLKALKMGKLSKVFVAQNCPEKTRKDVFYYANLASVLVIELGMNNEELGIFCKKNFFVSVLAVNA